MTTDPGKRARYFVLGLKKPKTINLRDLKRAALDSNLALQALGIIGRWPDSPLKQEARTLLQSELQKARIYEESISL